MTFKIGNTTWEGKLSNGIGMVETESGLIREKISHHSRFNEEDGTNPEELLGTAISASYSMALAQLLEQKGYRPLKLDTQVAVELEETDENQLEIPQIVITTYAKIIDIDHESFLQLADEAQKNCPITKALTGIHEIVLKTILNE
ncbi:MAG: OsmC family peroxiredoxin [Spirochaetes bacterium]|nr:OsmC family peroxiredoxin [Spirochaetota bacterium]